MFTPYARLPFYPGPVTLHPAAAEALRRDYGPPRFGTEYLELYRDVCGMLRRFAGTAHEVVLPTGAFRGDGRVWGWFCGHGGSHGLPGGEDFPAV